APSNRLLRDIVTGGRNAGTLAANDEDELPAKIVVVLDRGVENAHPALIDSIASYCQEHRDALTLATSVLVVPGGDKIKGDRRYTEGIIDAINASSLCRHSYVIAIGGGAVLDVAGLPPRTPAPGGWLNRGH